jgi:hypothetical protein
MSAISDKMYELFNAIEVGEVDAEQVIYACFNAMNDTQVDAVLAEFEDDGQDDDGQPSVEQEWEDFGESSGYEGYEGDYI